MNKLSELYTNHISNNNGFLNFQKKLDNNKKKNEEGKIKNFQSKFVKVKNESYEYLKVKITQCKTNISGSKIASYFQFYSLKCKNICWHKKLYYMLKYKIYKMLNLTNTDSMEQFINGKKENNDLNINNLKKTRTIRETIQTEISNRMYKLKSSNSNDSVIYNRSQMKEKENEKKVNGHSNSELSKKYFSFDSLMRFKNTESVHIDNDSEETSPNKTKLNEHILFKKIKETENVTEEKTKNENNFVKKGEILISSIKNSWKKLYTHTS
ncbi:conserved protein, unknown function [Hepatocystis sp. ex Piliocolobus tephrosceles]|nr:conserved protein, unknown function [Hepatocystis sp. ex Piliocolobus tephrosceles]